MPIRAKAMEHLPLDETEGFTLPAEPLQDGWGEKWDDDALELRFERFGLKFKKTSKGYSVIKDCTGKPLSLPLIGYEAVDRPRQDISELIEDLELAEVVKRIQLRE